MPNDRIMKGKSGRRSFLKNLAIGGLGATAVPGALANNGMVSKEPDSISTLFPKSSEPSDKKRTYNQAYTGEYLRKIAFPIGGMGAGMFCLEGTGAISHMSVRHKPEIYHEPNMFAAIAVKGQKIVAKVLEGPVPDWKMFGQRGSGNGAGGANYGLPRFDHAEFTARFPFATIELKDEKVPLNIHLLGWSPFIPTDEDNSSLPVGAFEYRFKNIGNKVVEAVFSYNSRNFVVQNNQKGAVKKIENGFIS